MDRLSASRDKEANLPAAKEAFESSYSTQTLKINIEVRRQKRGVKDVAEDLLFVVSFSASDAGNLPILDCHIGVCQSILTLIRELKGYFNDGKRGFAFFSANLESMISPGFFFEIKTFMDKKSKQFVMPS